MGVKAREIQEKMNLYSLKPMFQNPNLATGCIWDVYL